MAKTASCITTWRGCLKNSTVHASLLGMYHSATIQLLFFFDCAITSNFHILNPDMRQNCKVPLVCTHTHTLNQITLNWIRVDEHTRFKAIPIMELGHCSSYRKGKKSDNLSIVSANWKPDLSHDTCQNLGKTVFTLQEKSWHEATRRQSDQTNPEAWKRQAGMNATYVACNLLESDRSYYFGTHGWWQRWQGQVRGHPVARCRMAGQREHEMQDYRN